MKTVYVVRVYGHPEGTVYLGKDGRYITAPGSYKLMKFADEFGFATKEDAIEAPVSYLCDGKTTKAEIIPLEVW
jgi:hypothetical protein